MKKTYIKRGIWYLGGRKKQRGGFGAILGTFANPLLASAAGAFGGEVLKGLGEKFEEEEDNEEGTKEEDRKGVSMPRNNIFAWRLANSKRM